jgi:hypothetical protein
VLSNHEDEPGQQLQLVSLCQETKLFSTISANIFNRSAPLMREMKLPSLKSNEEIVHDYTYLNDVGAAADSNQLFSSQPTADKRLH